MQQSYPQLYCQSTTDLVALPIDSGSSVDVKTLVADVIDTVYDSDDEEHYVNFTQGDINGDGLLDIVYQRKIPDTKKMMALNKGDFTFDYQTLGSGTNINYKTKSLSVTDLNADGYADLSWHNESSNKRYISYWQPPTGSMSQGAFNTSLQEFSAQEDYNYSYQNMDGDAGLELVVLQQKSGIDKYIAVYELDTLPDGHNSIDTITNGLGAETNIEYSPLSDRHPGKAPPKIKDGVENEGLYKGALALVNGVHPASVVGQKTAFGIIFFHDGGFPMEVEVDFAPILVIDFKFPSDGAVFEAVLSGCAEVAVPSLDMDFLKAKPLVTQNALREVHGLAVVLR